MAEFLSPNESTLRLEYVGGSTRVFTGKSADKLYHYIKVYFLPNIGRIRKPSYQDKWITYAEEMTINHINMDNVLSIDYTVVRKH